MVPTDREQALEACQRYRSRIRFGSNRAGRIRQTKCRDASHAKWNVPAGRLSLLRTAKRYGTSAHATARRYG